MSSPGLGSIELLGPEHALEAFDCGTTELNTWLIRSARVAADAGTAATYVLARGRRVVGFYSLAMGSVAHGSSPSRLRRGMPDPVPVVVLARFGLDIGEQGKGIGGNLLVDALRRCLRGGQEFGARAIVVDAIDDRAFQFYEHFGFHRLDDRRLWRRIRDVERALQE